MAVWNGQVLWSFMVLLAGAVAQNVNYPVRPVCAMKGSTVTLPCTFTYKEIAEKNGRNVSMQIVRVLWCKNHEICQGTTPSVYDSESETNSRRFQYLGDKKGNCTLQISNVQMEDNATFRFRMEANVPVQNFTGKIGVNVTVNSKRADTRGGETVTLRCTSECSFYPLAINWSKDGLILPESGPVLRIGPVTAKDSGNYTCALKNKPNTGCMPYSMQVKEAKAGSFPHLHCRSCANIEYRKHLNSSLRLVFFEQFFYDRPQTSRAVEDVSYAAVQFKHNKQKRQMQEAEDSTVYSSVATQD
uniref:V-set and immunoglobulin domain-containing protein 2-like n=1 Tax=Acanthochromis polyacanthus TaxID=80966 RepID=A0A3Q1ED23_9TELE